VRKSYGNKIWEDLLLAYIGNSIKAILIYNYRWEMDTFQLNMWRG